MTWMATSDRIRRRTRTRTDGGGVCPFISHCISLSRLPPSRCGFESRRRRLAGPSTPPASPFRSAFLGCGNDGRDYLLSWRPAVRLISINLISIKVKGGTDEGDSAALAFRSELSGQGRRHGENDAWRPGGGGGVPSCDGERDVEGAGDLGIVGRRFTELVGRFVSEVASPVLEAMPGDAFHQGAAAQLTHMVKTRDGGETIRIIKTLAVKGRF